MKYENLEPFNGETVIVVVETNKNTQKVMYGKFAINDSGNFCYVDLFYIGKAEDIVSIKPWYGSNVRVIAYEPLRGDPQFDGYADFDDWLEHQPEGTSVQGGGIDKEPEEVIPKGFIDFNGAFLNACYIVSVHKYLCEDDKYRTRIATPNGEYYADTPVDEIMAKIAEALNG